MHEMTGDQRLVRRQSPLSVSRVESRVTPSTSRPSSAVGIPARALLSPWRRDKTLLSAFVQALQLPAYGPFRRLLGMRHEVDQKWP